MERIRAALGVRINSKECFDFVCSLVGIVLLSPVIFLAGVLIFLTSGGPIFYTQKRVGLNGKEFGIIKFRTMIVGADKMVGELAHLNERDGPVFKITNDPRCTRVGKIFRKYCIDEIPQLFNILKGDMSFVGPRPPLVDEVKKYEPWHRKRLKVKPGLTCYWQISDREMTFDEWVKSDLKYIKQRNFWLDLWLILKTIPVFIRGHR